MFVFSNLAISVDGKIAPASREHCPIGTPYDREMMQEIRRKSDCILMGASTIRAYKKPCLAKGATQQPINAIVTRALDGFDENWPFFTTDKMKRVLFTTEKVAREKFEILSKNSLIISLEPLQPGRSHAEQMMSALEKQCGVKNLLVEGGGHVMWDFASLNLIDEYYVTLAPKILGGVDSPTMVEGAGFKPSEFLNLNIKSSRVVGDEIYLCYQKTNIRG